MNPDDLLQAQNPWWQDGGIRRARAYPARRDLQPRILKQIRRADDRQALVLMGPRQVGKTVLLLQLADDLLDAGWPPQNLTYCDFSDERITGTVTARDVVDVRPVGMDPSHPRAFLLDEIRSSPKWDLWLKQAVDAGVGRIVATDSAAGLLWEGTRESGQGRWQEVYIEGLSFREFARLHGSPEIEAETPLRTQTLFQRYLSLGGFPGYALSEDFPEVWRRLRSDIAERAIERDLGRLGLDVQRVKDLFVYILRDSGKEFNAEARASDLQADPRSVRDWVAHLRNSLLISALERFVSHPAAALRSRSKLFAADPGLVLAFTLLSPTEAEARSAVFEAAVFRHLREAARDHEARLGYFRHKEDLEIDFVHQAPGAGPVGIEVTSSRQIRPEKVSRLVRAGQHLEAERLVLVHGGPTERAIEGVRTVSLLQFLLDPASSLR